MTTSALRIIETESYAKVSPPSTFGRPPRLEWIAIRDLVVDPEYQRDISFVGRKNIRRIAGEFNWSMFAPIIVAPAGSSKFAIVDGQHRATAAALCGLDKVPCAIVECERGEQAAAFKAINVNTTKLSPLQIHHAALAAGEIRASRIDKICATAGVVVTRYPKPWNEIKIGETMAVTYVGRAIEKFGDEIVVAALTAIRQSGDGNVGLLRAIIIYGACEVVADHPEWRKDQARLTAAFDEIDLGAMHDEAVATAARMRGTSALNQFEARLASALTNAFKTKTPSSPPRAASVPTIASPPGRAPILVAFNGKDFEIDELSGRVAFRGHARIFSRREAKLIGLLARAMPNPADTHFLATRVYGNQRGAADLLDNLARVIAPGLKSIGLEIRVIKGVGIGLTSIGA